LGFFASFIFESDLFILINLAVFFIGQIEFIMNLGVGGGIKKFDIGQPEVKRTLPGC
jgi:hypothetical protein